MTATKTTEIERCNLFTNRKSFYKGLYLDRVDVGLVREMVTISWQRFKEADPSKVYLAYGAYLERKTAWSYFDYLMRARKVQKQLEKAKGVVGFTARLEFLSKKAVQVAVFDDEKSLEEFAHAGQHALCSKEKKDSMNWRKTATWNISASEIPLKLEETINRIQSQQ